MSRCFPYPPPGYSRNGTTYEALIESIKLQKEIIKTKTERKKEKRDKKDKKEKRHKEKRNKKDENTNGDVRKVLQKASSSTEAQFQETKVTAEVLEKSDLTEEHGPASYQPSYSSDSTQNSNKRKRDDVRSKPDGSAVHGKGKPIKITLLKKHKGSDSSDLFVDAISKTHPSVPSRNNSVHATSERENRGPTTPNPVSEGINVDAISKTRPLVPSRNNGVHATSERENRGPTTPNPVSEGIKFSDPKMLHVSRKPSAPTSVKPVHPAGLKKRVVEVLQSTKLQPISSFGGHVPRIDLEHEIPSSSDVSRHVGVQEHLSGRQQQQPPSNHGTLDRISNKTTTSAAVAVKRPHHEITVSVNAGLTTLKKHKEDSQKVVPTRSEKKKLEKHAKYEKLLGSWLPPVSQAHLPDDEDWLSGSSMSSSVVSKAEAESCFQLVTPWQPCARFLADVDIHAMPYTVPF